MLRRFLLCFLLFLLALLLFPKASQAQPPAPGVVICEYEERIENPDGSITSSVRYVTDCALFSMVFHP
jgi:hypothetical protein